MSTALVAMRSSSQGDALVNLATDKDYPLAMFRERVFGNQSLNKLVNKFLLRGRSTQKLRGRSLSFDSIVTQGLNPYLDNYRGTPSQNDAINRSFDASYNPFIGQEAAAELEGGVSFSNLTDFPEYYRNIPIAIIGRGAAGIITARSLYVHGFCNVTVFERRDKQAGGIWAQKSVHGGSRNNPRNLKLFNQALTAAPGSGVEVLRVLTQLDRYHLFRYGYRGPKELRIGVKRIIPGDLQHTLELDDGTTREFGIVINCCGLGSPRPISDPAKMIGPKDHVRAVRWQYPQLSYEEARNKMFIFVGLGNSTAEMMQIIQNFRRKHGCHVDYRILTHYPSEAIRQPNSTVTHAGIDYRMFRDLSKPDLTAFQGDLEASREAFDTAVKGKKIITDVVEWDVKLLPDGRRHIGVRTRDDDQIRGLCDFDELYVMTGYQHTAKALDAMGFSYDKIGLYPHFDYDGEFMRDTTASGGDRLFKGYFGIGSILNSPGNRNSIVIPGMIFRAPDLIFGVILRTAEYFHRQKVHGRKLAQTLLSQIDPAILADYDIRLIKKR